MQLMQVDQVFQQVEAKGTKIATVDFVKKDGSIRKANGLFKPSSHIVGSERGALQGNLMREKGLVPMYDLQKRAWISFYADRVVGIK